MSRRQKVEESDNDQPDVMQAGRQRGVLEHVDTADDADGYNPGTVAAAKQVESLNTSVRIP